MELSLLDKSSMPLESKEFRYIFDEYYQPLCNYAFKYTKDIEKAEDIVQDVFVKIWLKQKMINKSQNWVSYLFMMVKNRTLDELKRDNVGMKITQEYYHSKENQVYLTVDENEIEYYLTLDTLYKSIQSLPPKCSEVFTMNKINGISQQDIAERLGISIKTVEAHMAKAYKLLRSSLIVRLCIFSSLIELF